MHINSFELLVNLVIFILLFVFQIRFTHSWLFRLLFCFSFQTPCLWSSRPRSSYYLRFCLILTHLKLSCDVWAKYYQLLLLGFRGIGSFTFGVRVILRRYVECYLGSCHTSLLRNLYSLSYVPTFRLRFDRPQQIRMNLEISSF